MISCSLYIHIPFCRSLCDYCDFYSVNINNFSDDYVDSFLSALIFDIKHQIDFFNVNEIKSCYIGGGTPSVLGKRIRILLKALNIMPEFSPVEFSMEANPESINEEFLSLCREGGVNRLSLGVQTFHEPSRLAVNRAGSVCDERLALASRYFPDMLSADLITGLPYQKKRTVLDDIKRLLTFEPVHVSLYSLSVENDTPLEEKINNKTVTLPKGGFSDSLWLTGRDALLKEGFNHYEVSNFSLQGKECLHNLNYWQMQNWLGAGPSASGTIIEENSNNVSLGGAAHAKRYTYPVDIDKYIKSTGNYQVTVNKKQLFPAVNCEELDRKTLLKECILMGFRCKNGPNPHLFKKRFDCTVEECIGLTLEKWKNKDVMLFLNRFLADAFTELDKRN